MGGCTSEGHGPPRHCPLHQILRHSLPPCYTMHTGTSPLHWDCSCFPAPRIMSALPVHLLHQANGQSWCTEYISSPCPPPHWVYRCFPLPSHTALDMWVLPRPPPQLHLQCTSSHCCTLCVGTWAHGHRCPSSTFNYLGPGSSTAPGCPGELYHGIPLHNELCFCSTMPLGMRQKAEAWRKGSAGHPAAAAAARPMGRAVTR